MSTFDQFYPTPPLFSKEGEIAFLWKLLAEVDLDLFVANNDEIHLLEYRNNIDEPYSPVNPTLADVKIFWDIIQHLLEKIAQQAKTILVQPNWEVSLCSPQNLTASVERNRGTWCTQMRTALILSTF